MSTSLTDLLRRRRVRQPMDERLPDGRSVDELIFNKRGGGYDIYGGLNRRLDESATDAKRRLDMQAAMVGQGDPTTEGAATFAPPGEQDTALDYAPRLSDRLRSRPRTTQPTSVTAETRPRAVTFDPATGKPNEDFYRQRNDPAGLYNAYQNWQPHGGKRGFKNSLKGALMMAGQAVQSNPDDPVTAAIAGFATGLGGATAAPNFTNRLRRQQRLGQYGSELKNQLELKKQQAAIDQSQMVEVELDNGQKVLVPAKSAATLASHQQEIGMRGDTLEARKKRWDALGEHEGARDAQALYNSGAADDSAELRAEIAKRLRLPAGTVLPPRGLGNQVKLDESGNYIVISPRSGQVTATNQKSYEPTREKGRDRRATAAQQAASARTQYIQEQTNKRAGMRGGAARVDPATKREIAKGVGVVEQLKGELSALDEQIQRLDAAAKGRAQTPEEVQRLTSLGRQRAEKVNQAKAAAAQLDALDPENETGVGEGGYPYRKPRAAQTGTEDPKVRAYADRFFGGNYEAAQEAIRKQRGQ